MTPWGGQPFRLSISEVVNFAIIWLRRRVRPSPDKLGEEIKRRGILFYLISEPSPSLKEGSLRYHNINPFNKKWQRTASYGGKLFENACQAVARDVMAANMPLIENSGYKIILSVHDELLTETEDLEICNEETLSTFLSRNPKWAFGLPLAAGGFEAYRYRKG